MSRSRWLICAIYALISAAALIATSSQNVAYFGGGMLDAFVRFFEDTKVNPASRSITVDIGLLLLAAVFFMVIEARRLGVRFVWLYVLGGFLVAISVTFPLFMIAREFRRASLGEADAALTAVDAAGLGIVTLVVLYLSWSLIA